MKILLVFLSQLSAHDTLSTPPTMIFNNLPVIDITPHDFPFLYSKLDSENSKKPPTTIEPPKKDNNPEVPVVRSTRKNLQFKQHIKKPNVRTPEDRNSILINGEPRHFLTRQKNKTQILGVIPEKDSYDEDSYDFEEYYNSKSRESDDTSDSEANDWGSYLEYQREHKD